MDSSEININDEIAKLLQKGEELSENVKAFKDAALQLVTRVALNQQVSLSQQISPGERAYTELGLDARKSLVLDMIVAANGICKKEDIITRLYESGRRVPATADAVVKNIVIAIRRSLVPHDISIQTFRKIGYSMKFEAKLRLRDILQPKS